MAKKKKGGKADDEKPKKKKAKPREQEEELEEEEEYSPTAAAKPRLDIYVGLSALTFLVLVGAAVLFYLDADASKGKQSPAVSLTLAPLRGGAATAATVPQPPPAPRGVPGP